MIKKTKRRLILLYTLTISVLLTILFCFSFLFVRQQISSNQIKNFENLNEQLDSKLQVEQKINLVWLSKLQRDNNLLAFIEDNGIQIRTPSPYETSSLEPSPFSLIKEKCQQENLHIMNPVYPFLKEKSPIYRVHSGNKNYLGCATLYPVKNGWCRLTLCQKTTYYDSLMIRYGLVFICLYVACIIFVFVFSKHFVHKTLLPVLESQKKQKEFIAAASHELRSPLAVIQSTLSLIELSSTKEQQEPIQDIVAEITHMSRLIEDLLTLATAQSKGWQIQKQLFDVETLLIELYDNYVTIADKKEISLEISLPDDQLPPLNADMARIRQVLMILLDNALSYTPSGKSILLQALCTGQAITLSVIDTGIGIPDEEKKEIFETFYRSSTSRSNKSHFGLGLSIAKEIVTLHNGSIKVSDTKNGGATFRVELPLT